MEKSHELSKPEDFVSDIQMGKINSAEEERVRGTLGKHSDIVDESAILEIIKREQASALEEFVRNLKLGNDFVDTYADSGFRLYVIEAGRDVMNNHGFEINGRQVRENAWVYELENTHVQSGIILNPNARSLLAYNIKAPGIDEFQIKNEDIIRLEGLDKKTLIQCLYFNWDLSPKSPEEVDMDRMVFVG